MSTEGAEHLLGYFKSWRLPKQIMQQGEDRREQSCEDRKSLDLITGKEINIMSFVRPSTVPHGAKTQKNIIIIIIIITYVETSNIKE